MLSIVQSQVRPPSTSFSCVRVLVLCAMYTVRCCTSHVLLFAANFHLHHVIPNLLSCKCSMHLLNMNKLCWLAETCKILLLLLLLLIAMIGTSDRLCWLAETCKILLLLSSCQTVMQTMHGKAPDQISRNMRNLIERPITQRPMTCPLCSDLRQHQ